MHEDELVGRRVLDLGQSEDSWDHIDRFSDDFFPMPSYRDGQKEAICKILEAFKSGKKYVIAECPTGSGKSAIAYTVSQFFDKSYWITIQKSLQDQLMGDYGASGKHIKNRHVLVDLKGRGNYPCNYWDRKIAEGIPEEDVKRYKTAANKKPGCDVGKCKQDGRSKDSYCFPKEEDYIAGCDVNSYCPYWQRKHEAITSDVCLMNFSSFLFQTRLTNDFEPRNLLIIDESHNTESELMRFIELTISDKDFRFKGIRFPNLNDAKEYAAYFIKIKLEELVRDKIKTAQLAQNAKDENEWKTVLVKYANFLKSARSGNWVSEFKPRLTNSGENLYNVVSLKPLFIDKYAQEYMFSLGCHVLMMSATILSKQVMCNGLGIDSHEVFAYRMKNRFPLANRRIKYEPCGSLSYRNKRGTFPKLVQKINQICANHPDQKGIIHTHTFEISGLLIEKCHPDVSSRFLFQKDFDTKQDMLDWHAKEDKSIIIAPAMHEGLDLKDDLSRFQIICKVPYPSMSDPQIKARMELSHRFYEWITAQKLVQSYGRSVRSEKDWAETYVVDSEFKRFYEVARSMLPSWFKEAIVW